MKWVVVENYAALSATAARILLETITKKPVAVLALPTGRTPEGMYANVVSACVGKGRCFRDVTTFNLDEYVGIPPQHPGSYLSYMKRHLIDHVDIDRENVNIPDGLAARVRKEQPELSLDEALGVECARYEEKIRKAGGIDLTFLGLGRNGHIGFNEPGTPFDSRTHVIRLSESTRIANAELFVDEPVPERAITMGIGTILESGAIVLMASGSAKAAAVKTLAESDPNPAFPASGLRNHGDVTVLVDSAASSLLPPQPARTRGRGDTETRRPQKPTSDWFAGLLCRSGFPVPGFCKFRASSLLRPRVPASPRLRVRVGGGGKRH